MTTKNSGKPEVKSGYFRTRQPETRPIVFWVAYKNMRVVTSSSKNGLWTKTALEV
jgi:hypothetical protein